MADPLQETVDIKDTTQPASVSSGSAASSPQVTPVSNQPPPPAPQQERMGCTGDCRRCHEIQRGYCASQIAYNMQNAVAHIEGTVATLTQVVAAIAAEVQSLKAHLEAPSQKPDLFTPEQPTTKGKKK